MFSSFLQCKNEVNVNLDFTSTAKDSVTISYLKYFLYYVIILSQNKCKISAKLWQNSSNNTFYMLLLFLNDKINPEVKTMEKKLIYVADDEINICNIIKSFLMKEGYEVEAFHNGRSILDAFGKRQADMLVIDIMMPEMDGYSLCSMIRQQSPVPVIFVSAKDTDLDKIAGLTLGGDDYLTKPFSPMELVARVKSIFRRVEMDKTTPKSNLKIIIKDITIDTDNKQVIFEDKSIGLTMMEFSLLSYLALNKDRAIGRNELLDKVWGFENEVETRATDDMIKRVRKKLSDAGSTLKVETIWGFGFRIQDKE